MVGGKILTITLGFALAVSAQRPLRQWASAEEYDMGSQALAETDPSQKITLLRDWLARYPSSEFERERRISFALAFQQIGNPQEAFKWAGNALALNAEDPSVLLLIAALGPTLPAASESDRATVVTSAVKLLSMRISPPPEAIEAAKSRPLTGATLVDPEVQRVLVFIRRLRAARGPVVEKYPELIKRQVAETALEWARNKNPSAVFR